MIDSLKIFLNFFFIKSVKKIFRYIKNNNKYKVFSKINQKYYSSKKKDNEEAFFLLGEHFDQDFSKSFIKKIHSSSKIYTFYKLYNRSKDYLIVKKNNIVLDSKYFSNNKVPTLLIISMYILNVLSAILFCLIYILAKNYGFSYTVIPFILFVIIFPHGIAKIIDFKERSAAIELSNVKF